MKKVISILLVICMLSTLCACSAEKPSEDPKVSATEKTAATTTDVETTEDPMAEDMEILSAIGDVSVENGILTVSVTVPAAHARWESAKKACALGKIKSARIVIVKRIAKGSPICYSIQKEQAGRNHGAAAWEISGSSRHYHLAGASCHLRKPDTRT